MAITYTKAQILALSPCYPWGPVLIPAYPQDPATPQEVYAYLVAEELTDVLPWFMGSFVEGAQGMIEEAGVAVDNLDHYNRSALHLAAIKTKPDVITYLLSKGADKTLLDRDNLSPVDLALLTSDQATIDAMGE